MADHGARDGDLELAARLMERFLLATGVVGDAPQRRYLWTDAFAVCTLLSLDEAGVAPELDDFDGFRPVALRLTNLVHHVLGRHRDDDPRRGWISGLSEEEGLRQPTAGGLRIGKPLPERGPGDAMDERLEWERDGQYFHYLTKWMHALRTVGASEGDPRYLSWAVTLAKAAHHGFVRRSALGGRILCWKMSIDLSRPLVGSTGQHDPLDGYLTYRTLVAPGTPLRAGSEGLLDDEIADLSSLARLHDWRRWITDDPLGLGGLLTDAHRVAQLQAHGVREPTGLLTGLLEAAATGIRHYKASGPLRRPLTSRLPFRELGLSIGLHALERLPSLLGAAGGSEASSAVQERLDALRADADGLAQRIEEAWRPRQSREVHTWQAHEDINGVMLATSLAPDGYLAF